MGGIELVVTDLDGTLWSYDSLHTPHPATLTAWRALEEGGIPVLVATGRRVTSTREPLAALGLTPSAVVLDGALALDLATDEYFHRRVYDVADAAAVLAVFRTHGLDPCIYVEHDRIDVYVSEQPSTSPDHLARLGARACRADLDEIVATTPVLGFGLFGLPVERLTRVAAGFDERSAPRMLPDTFSNAHALTVGPHGCSKWTGVLAYCDRAGIDPGRVLAIGDSVNDVELLTHAAIGVTLVDAHPAALAVADHVVASSDDGGWAQILDVL